MVCHYSSLTSAYQPPANRLAYVMRIVFCNPLPFFIRQSAWQSLSLHLRQPLLPMSGVLGIYHRRPTGFQFPSKDPPKRQKPRSWPALIAWIIAWIGSCSWTEWLKITAFASVIAAVVSVVVVAARVVGW